MNEHAQTNSDGRTLIVCAVQAEAGAVARGLGFGRDLPDKLWSPIPVRDGFDVLISGVGIIGLMAVTVAKAAGAQVIAHGFVPGSASAVGLEGVTIVADDLIPKEVNLVAGANKPDTHLLNVNYGRDWQADIVADIALASDICDTGVCTIPDCSDAAQNQDETDVDCGGAVCFTCTDGLACIGDTDCDSDFCELGACNHSCPH